MSDEDGEARDTAAPEETALDHVEPTENAETEFHPFDETYDDFKPGPLRIVKDANGVWGQVDQTSESDIPALSTTTLVCMGDFSEFVVRDRWGEPIAKLAPNVVELAPNGRWRARSDVVTKEAAFWIAAMKKRLAEVKKKVADVQVNVSEDPIALILSMRGEPGEALAYDPDWIEVDPIRPPCRHYVRQQGSFHLNAANKKYYRLCSARRTTEGTFMTVSDTGMWACDMRDPYDAESVKTLDEFDKLKVEQGRTRQHLPMFQSAAIVKDGTIYDPPKQN